MEITGGAGEPRRADAEDSDLPGQASIRRDHDPVLEREDHLPRRGPCSVHEPLLIATAAGALLIVNAVQLAAGSERPEAPVRVLLPPEEAGAVDGGAVEDQGLPPAETIGPPGSQELQPPERSRTQARMAPVVP